MLNIHISHRISSTHLITRQVIRFIKHLCISAYEAEQCDDNDDDEDDDDDDNDDD